MANSTDRAIARIREMIVDGDLKPGDRLPPEKQLGETIGVSRNSLREAVKALEVMRVLDVRQGDGTYVTSLDASVIAEALTLVLELHRDDSILEMLEMRRVLEPHATAKAALKIDDATLTALADELRNLDDATGVDDLVAHDLAFHRAIAQASGNRHLAGLLDALAGSTLRVRIWRGLTDSGAVPRTLAEHRAILRALQARDPELARLWATVHVRGVETWLEESAL